MDSLDEGKWSEKGDFAKAELTYLLPRTMHTTIYICVSFCATDGLSVQLPMPQPYFLLQLQQLWSSRSGKKAGRGGGDSLAARRLLGIVVLLVWEAG